MLTSLNKEVSIFRLELTNFVFLKLKKANRQWLKAKKI